MNTEAQICPPEVLIQSGANSKPFKILTFILVTIKVNLNKGVHYMIPYSIVMFYTSKLLDYSTVNISDKPCDT